MKFTKRKTEIWNYPILSEHHDKIMDVKEYVSKFETLPIDRPISMYIHIPFCKSFCYFCPYCKESARSKKIESLFECILTEIRAYAKVLRSKSVKISSIHFGGGSPSCVPSHYLSQIFKTISSEFDTTDCKTISMEGNVTDLNYEYLLQIKEIGVNRLGFGIQTFNTNIRKKIGIRAEVDDIFRAVESLKRSGILNYSADLMYNLPDQTIDDLNYDFDMLQKLDLSSVELCGLNVYPNSVFEKLLHKEGYFDTLPSDEKDIEMFTHLSNLFVQNGYSKVLGNIFAKMSLDIPDTVQSFFDGYTIGVGPSSKSSVMNMNYRNNSSLDKYITSVNDCGFGISIGKYCNDDELDIRNMIISCNLLQIDKAKIGNLDNFRDTIDRLKEGGYITETSSHINVTDKGSLRVGNISYQFLDQKSKAKILQLYLDALRYKENPYNQDNMLVVS